MADRNPAPYDKTTHDRRSPLTNDVDPDGMDSDTEGDRDEADGTTNERQAARQGETSAAHGKADPDTARRNDTRRD